MSGPPQFVVRVGLGEVPADLAEVRGEIGDRLDAYEPRLVREDRDLALSLTIGARDLWVAVLEAMAAVTGTGYPVVRLEAGPRDGGSSGRH